RRSQRRLLRIAKGFRTRCYSSPALARIAKGGGCGRLTERRTMTDAAKKDLVKALAELLKERRLCAELLSKPYERGGTYEATMTRFVEFQTAIEAVERALVSESDYP